MNRPQMGPRMVSEPGQQTMIRHRESAAADTLQEKVFTNWANFILKSRNLQIQSVLKNIGDGVILLQLAEILTGTKIHTYNKKPNQPAQKLENIQIAVNTFKQDGLKLSVDNKGIVEMEPKPTLAMFWNIIVHYGLGSAVPDSTFGKSGDQDEDLNRLAAELERLRAENADYARIKEENSRQKEGTLSEVSDPCGKCGKSLAEGGGEVLIVNSGAKYHASCFVCAKCNKPFEVNAHYWTHERAIYCFEHYLQVNGKKCDGCGQVIKGDQIIFANNTTWHNECFVCTTCKNPFHAEYTMHQQRPYCKQDYYRIRGWLCGRCDQVISKSDIRAMGKVWHSKCFTCWKCEKPFSEEGFFEYQANPYCGNCHKVCAK